MAGYARTTTNGRTDIILHDGGVGCRVFVEGDPHYNGSHIVVSDASQEVAVYRAEGSPVISRTDVTIESPCHNASRSTDGCSLISGQLVGFALREAAIELDKVILFRDAPERNTSVGFSSRLAAVDASRRAVRLMNITMHLIATINLNMTRAELNGSHIVFVADDIMVTLTVAGVPHINGSQITISDNSRIVTALVSWNGSTAVFNGTCVALRAAGLDVVSVPAAGVAVLAGTILSIVSDNGKTEATVEVGRMIRVSSSNVTFWGAFGLTLTQVIRCPISFYNGSHLIIHGPYGVPQLVMEPSGHPAIDSDGISFDSKCTESCLTIDISGPFHYSSSIMSVSGTYDKAVLRIPATSVTMATDGVMRFLNMEGVPLASVRHSASATIYLADDRVALLEHVDWHGSCTLALTAARQWQSQIGTLDVTEGSQRSFNGSHMSVRSNEQSVELYLQQPRIVLVETVDGGSCCIIDEYDRLRTIFPFGSDLLLSEQYLESTGKVPYKVFAGGLPVCNGTHVNIYREGIVVMSIAVRSIVRVKKDGIAFMPNNGGILFTIAIGNSHSITLSDEVLEFVIGTRVVFKLHLGPSHLDFTSTSLTFSGLSLKVHVTVEYPIAVAEISNGTVRLTGASRKNLNSLSSDVLNAIAVRARESMNASFDSKLLSVTSNNSPIINIQCPGTCALYAHSTNVTMRDSRGVHVAIFDVRGRIGLKADSGVIFVSGIDRSLAIKLNSAAIIPVFNGSHVVVLSAATGQLLAVVKPRILTLDTLDLAIDESDARSIFEDAAYRLAIVGNPQVVESGGYNGTRIDFLSPTGPTATLSVLNSSVAKEDTANDNIFLLLDSNGVPQASLNSSGSVLIRDGISVVFHNTVGNVIAAVQFNDDWYSSSNGSHVVITSARTCAVLAVVTVHSIPELDESGTLCNVTHGDISLSSSVTKPNINARPSEIRTRNGAAVKFVNESNAILLIVCPKPAPEDFFNDTHSLLLRGSVIRYSFKHGVAAYFSASITVNGTDLAEPFTLHPILTSTRERARQRLAKDEDDMYSATASLGNDSKMYAVASRLAYIMMLTLCCIFLVGAGVVYAIMQWSNRKHEYLVSKKLITDSVTSL